MEPINLLIIQIPCYNEESTLGITLSELPRQIQGVDKVEWLIVDDGSTDKTVEVAKTFGVDHIICLDKHRGLAAAFNAGMITCIRLRANLIVNTDADNQYNAKDIQNLIQPILKGDADFVLGVRPLWKTQDFSVSKKLLHWIGGLIASTLCGRRVLDPTSGFRAMSLKTILSFRITDKYTYTLETLMQACHSHLRLSFVPIRTNRALRSSRLITHLGLYLWHSFCTLIRSYFFIKTSGENFLFYKRVFQKQRPFPQTLTAWKNYFLKS